MSTDHLARAKDYIAKGDEYYAKAADEIIAAKKADPQLSNYTIGERLGRNESWVRRLVQSRTNAPRATDAPFEVDWESGSNKRDEVTRTTLAKAKPETLRNIVRDLDDDAREALVDAAIKVTSQEARAKTEEHKTKTSLSDVGGIGSFTDRTQFEIDVPLTKAWRYAREAARILGEKGLWVGDDRYDEMLDRATELESAAAEIRAALQEALNEKAMA